MCEPTSFSLKQIEHFELDFPVLKQGHFATCLLLWSLLKNVPAVVPLSRNGHIHHVPRYLINVEYLIRTLCQKKEKKERLRSIQLLEIGPSFPMEPDSMPKIGQNVFLTHTSIFHSEDLCYALLQSGLLR